MSAINPAVATHREPPARPPLDPAFTDKSHLSTFFFSHPQAGDMSTDYGVNEVFWTYELNTQNYQTYAGEVVQILSCFIGDITLRGQVGTYAQMEAFHKYWALYMEQATQGAFKQGSFTRYSEEPVKVIYPERDWEFYIQPKTTVGWRYGRDVIVPEWTLTAAVYDGTPDRPNTLEGLTIEEITEQGEDNDFDLDGSIGFNLHNPYQVPFPDEGILGKFDQQKTSSIINKYGTYYSDIVQSYAGKDYTKGIFDQYKDGGASKPPSNK